jgi:putative Mg2+ transporter-C (MgtC) family protein
MSSTRLHIEIAARLAVALVLGLILGAEREARDQPAGLRTHALVSVGAALFGVISVFGFLPYTGVDTRTDMSRVAAQVPSGIGFLGAGAILRFGATVRGLTTAASLWVVAAVGLAAGLGMYVAATFVTVGSVITLMVFRLIRRPLRGLLTAGRFSVTIEYDRKADLGVLISELSRRPLELDHLDLEDEGGDKARTIYAVLRCQPGVQPEQAVMKVADLEGVQSIEYGR